MIWIQKFALNSPSALSTTLLLKSYQGWRKHCSEKILGILNQLVAKLPRKIPQIRRHQEPKDQKYRLLCSIPPTVESIRCLLILQIAWLKVQVFIEHFRVHTSRIACRNSLGSKRENRILQMIPRQLHQIWSSMSRSSLLLQALLRQRRRE